MIPNKFKTYYPHSGGIAVRHASLPREKKSSEEEDMMITMSTENDIKMKLVFEFETESTFFYKLTHIL